MEGGAPAFGKPALTPTAPAACTCEHVGSIKCGAERTALPHAAVCEVTTEVTPCTNSMLLAGSADKGESGGGQRLARGAWKATGRGQEASAAGLGGEECLAARRVGGSGASERRGLTGRAPSSSTAQRGLRFFTGFTLP
jgi:hypothetical protein